ncbi:electron transport complex subunit RsxC [Enterococcus gilvus]|jgi:Na+-translocating ferredoxin:NAD+ oxidoreductase subunit C|uniref:electron transport complex subunit RsxC n=1 Tax=Enterococcus gilvus TaxID=160453 RepID=UPI000DF6165F|nr:electron transport complex subunit RsxC [Enterococcus gilvus]AXG38733.1 electron transport complex subunit RsxC [Enterococcus gilvus]
MEALTKAIATFEGGVKVPHNKHTAEFESVFMTPPKLVTLPMQQHIGGRCTPLVKKGDSVTVGQKIADSEAFVSAPIHASVSGKVKGIKPVLMANGQMCDAIHIASDGLPVVFPDPQPVAIDSKEALLKAARDSGVVGIGGAGFPLHVKLAVKDDTPIDTLVINGAECEPFITSDYRESLEYPERIIAGMQMVMKHLKITRGVVGIESNKPKGLKRLRDHLNELADRDPAITVMEIPSLYPQGAEKMLVYATTGRKIPPGKLPSEVGCLILNISTISLLQRYVETGMPLTHKRITVDGNVPEPKNIVVPVGTPMGEVIACCGGLIDEPSKVILGGPMMGVAQFSVELPITKQTNAITILSQSERLPEESPCIRCGRCVEACPMSLLPVQIERCTRNKDVSGLKKLKVSACMECGCCAFVCPAGRRLVQTMKQGKQLEREAAK